jgi:hypothetical protein
MDSIFESMPDALTSVSTANYVLGAVVQNLYKAPKSPL